MSDCQIKRDDYIKRKREENFFEIKTKEKEKMIFFKKVRMMM